MTVKMLHYLFNTKTEDKSELLRLAYDLLQNKKIKLSDYAGLKASINMFEPAEIEAIDFKG